MASWIEIEVSTSGISDGAFEPLATVADTTLGGSPSPVQFDHAPVIPGQLYIYRTRRYDDVTGLRSAWSCLVFARGPYPSESGLGTSTMCVNDIKSGHDTEIYIALEPCQGIPMKAAYTGEYRQGGIGRDMIRLYGQSLRKSTTMRRKVVRGRTVYEGSIQVEVTPEGFFPTLMTALFPIETFDSGTLPVGAPALSSSAYRHRWTNKTGGKSVTIIHRKGDLFQVYPGCVVSSVEFTTNKETDDILVATFQLVALDELEFPLDTVSTAPTLLGTATAGLDPLPPYSPADASVIIGSAEGDVKSITFTVTNNLLPRNVLNRKRGPKAHKRTSTDVTGSAVCEWSTDINLQRDLGVTSPAGSYAAGDVIATAAVTCDYLPPANGAGIVNRLGFTFPAADIKSAEPVEGPGEVPQNLTFIPIDEIGNAAATDFYVEIDNSLTNAQMLAYGQAILSVPASRSLAYAYGVVKTGSTTTSIVSDSAHLSSVDDFYNGKTLRILTGTLAGVSKTISDYVGSTHTFTVGAFASSPSANVIFEIV